MHQITWKLTVDQANYILAALGKQPFMEVRPLIEELIKQANEAQAAQAVPPSLTVVPTDAGSVAA